jgi:hypothetical protein
VSYAAAIDAAFDWFEEWNARGEAAERAPRGRTDSLSFCTIGDVYSVGHALHDYLDWAKVARSPGGHYNALVLLNHHLSNGVTNIPLDQFKSSDLQRIALQIIETPPRFGFSLRHKPPVRREDLTPD